jgi:hypothetical protein
MGDEREDLPPAGWRRRGNPEFLFQVSDEQGRPLFRDEDEFVGFVMAYLREHGFVEEEDEVDE